MNSISPTPPAGSRIRIKSNDGDPVIVIPADGSWMRYGIGAFVLCWLGGWFFGFRSALTRLLSGTAAPAQGFFSFGSPDGRWEEPWRYSIAIGCFGRRFRTR
jgi:hypothetical protein